MNNADLQKDKNYDRKSERGILYDLCQTPIFRLDKIYIRRILISGKKTLITVFMTIIAAFYDYYII